MIVFPNAKINLGLRVLRRRSDNFHDIETVFYPVPWCDALEIIPSPDGTHSFTTSGLPVPGAEEHNLCLRAWRLIQQQHSLPQVHMHLYKAIPMGAGLGGGSSDAAHTLIAANKLFDLNLSKETLAQMAATLGSDCPFFIYNKPMLATGRGEQLQRIDIDLSQYAIFVVKPQIAISTAVAYASLSPAENSDAQQAIQLHPKYWKDKLINDFEATVTRAHPQIAAIKEKLYEAGAIYAAMSGSGSAVYGLFKDLQRVKKMEWEECAIWASE